MRPTLLLFLLGANLLVAPSIFAQAAPIAPKPAEVQHLRDLSASFETLAARVRPAVVQIFSTGYATTEDTDSTNAALLSPQHSTGSGVILTPDGYIVTNNHVVQGARRIEVRLSSTGAARAPEQAREQTMVAKLIGTDRDSDLAVIKIERDGLPFLSLGDSNDLKQGQLVMAFGNPLGLEGSASMGIVSSVGRRLRPEDARTYVQTDAPINPGNSGGPLVDINGQVMGINTFILTQSGGSEGIGFAIPANSVKNVYEQIRKEGHVHRGQIGVSVQTITPGMAKGLGLLQDWGVIAADVMPDGPADKAGMKVGDIILTLNGRAMEDAPSLETVVSHLKLSAVVDLTVLRDGQKVNFTIPVIERDDDPQRFADMVNPEDNLISKLGILGIEIDKKLSDLLSDLRHDYGILVAARGPSPPYSGGNLEPGDVIYEINRTPAVTVKALRATLDALKPSDNAVLQIERSGKLMYITIELE
ncbi:MAG TPA: trypsin-like peptidase domain-containing protein [Bryobacteraceae bacterium]|nr:trypsin-like peptidase domain-containing protein [Bryobacteraceae bacterium]